MSEQRVTKEQVSGVALIAAERQRQITEEGWTPFHDRHHDQQELADFAALYADPDHRLPVPKGFVFFPTKHTRIRQLTIAGALIAAEIDRLSSHTHRGEPVTTQHVVTSFRNHGFNASQADMRDNEHGAPHPQRRAGMSEARRHRHDFSALAWHFGQYGRQDVHVHSCYAGCWEGPLPDDACQRVLIGSGRSCDGKQSNHHRETLTDSPTEESRNE